MLVCTYMFGLMRHYHTGEALASIGSMQRAPLFTCVECFPYSECFLFKGCSSNDTESKSCRETTGMSFNNRAADKT